MDLFKESVDEIIPKVKTWRHHFHQYPELSFEEFKTTEYIIDKIKDFQDLTYERISPTGIVARLDGIKPGPVIALRADIDALPMTEKSGVEFASKNEGVMHACGHDCHTAMLLGALYVLYEHRKELEGSFVFIFQAAEETFPGGAKDLVKKGVLDGVDAIIGQHTSPKIPTGHIATRPGYIMSNSDSFELTIIGKGGHGSEPQACLDPLPVGAQIVTALQNIVSRHIPAQEQALLSVTQFNSGTAYNIIPDSAVIRGTIRTYSDKSRELMKKMIEKIGEKYAVASDMSIEYKYMCGYDSMYNSIEHTNLLMEVANELYGPKTVEVMDPGMGGEDFSYYLQKIPGCFYFFGVGNEELGCCYPVHSTKFKADEDSFAIGISIMLNSAIRFQKLVKKEA
jgi:amidohydrolase